MERGFMTIEKKDGFLVLSADEGFMITNGTLYGKKAYLSDGEDGDNWYETEEVCDEY
jgi:hypothetical protein